MVNFKKKPKSDCNTIGICAGCFTILTPNHVKYLEEARDACDYLIVITNSDKYILDKKGIVPISCEGRMQILSGLKSVDEVSSFEEEDEHDWIDRFKRTRLSEFAENAKTVVFHDQCAMFNKFPDDIPGFGVADIVTMISRKAGVAVSDIFRKIKNEK